MTISDWILLFTFIAIAWYSLETRGMKKELIRQNELSQRPCITINFIHNKGSYFFRNIGNGPALDTFIEPITIGDKDSPPFVFYCDHLEIIEPKEQPPIILRNEKGNISHENYLKIINPISGTTDIEVTIRYRSIDNVKYISRAKIGKSGAHFNNIERTN